MRQDKERIFQLRKDGRTYREIQRDTGVSRATLSLWFKDVKWSKHMREGHKNKNLGASKERMERMNMVRKLKLQYQYALAESEATKVYQKYKYETLFWAGLMLYAGEGDKKSKHLIRISNSEAYIHRIFVDFACKYLGFLKDRFRYSLIIYPDNKAEECINTWAEALGSSKEFFYKPNTIQGKEVKKRLQYGTCISIISSTEQKRRLLRWLSLAENEKFEDAAMVQG